MGRREGRDGRGETAEKLEVGSWKLGEKRETED
jgi:hypothetical protein